MCECGDVGEVRVVVAHNERATLRVGDVVLKIDADQTPPGYRLRFSHLATGDGQPPLVFSIRIDYIHDFLATPPCG